MSTNTLQNQLKLLGLNHSEIMVYLFLLENGATTPPNVSRETKIARTNCYNILSTLVEKGLVTKKEQGKKNIYLANDPEAILHFIEQKKEVARTILPDLNGLYTVQKNKPRIKFYNNINEVKNIYNESLASREVISLGSTNQLDVLTPGFESYYLKEVADRKISFSDVNYLGQTTIGESLTTKNKLQITSHILVWDNNVAFITLESPTFGTVLNNKSLAETFRLIAGIVSHETINGLSLSS